MSAMHFEHFEAATGLPRAAYDDWLALPDDKSRKDAVEILADPVELAAVLAAIAAQGGEK